MKHKSYLWAQVILHHVCRVIDGYSMIWRGKEIVVTSLWREKGKGYHPKNQAKDVRTWDWSPEFKAFIKKILIGIRTIDKRLQFEFEEDEYYPNGKLKKREHLHIESDDKSLV